MLSLFTVSLITLMSGQGEGQGWQAFQHWIVNNVKTAHSLSSSFLTWPGRAGTPGWRISSRGRCWQRRAAASGGSSCFFVWRSLGLPDCSNDICLICLFISQKNNSWAAWWCGGDGEHFNITNSLVLIPDRHVVISVLVIHLSCLIPEIIFLELQKESMLCSLLSRYFLWIVFIIWGNNDDQS